MRDSASVVHSWVALERTENEVAKATELIKLEEEVISTMEVEIFVQ